MSNNDSTLPPHRVPLTAWRSRGHPCQHCGRGESWVAAGGYEIHKRGEAWVAGHRGSIIAESDDLAVVMLQLAASPAEIPDNWVEKS